MSASCIQEYFENPAFRSDGLKIYPTLVIRGTGLYELWRTGRCVRIWPTLYAVLNCSNRYQNYTPNALIDIVARILALVPPWTRIYRVQRCIQDGPTYALAYFGVSCAQRYSDASCQLWSRKWKSSRASFRANERFRCGMSRCTESRGWHSWDPS